ncbi:hypothetical protein J7E83_05250 [Arthrobacter sp. ISL-48]|uniref:hypothetical protein n=1 Tax=Arthrobacter sp. ISL-48 TaxID=2819110 RepID=UPI001BE6BFFD|nr:hypothetical protein [Arthrobacter sp. ISL-48]MBT2531543.1 hypothetical protein [Arthrobacter sp. ISL-48]
MSQEQPPVRSRRELRQARDEQQATGSAGPGLVSPASKQPADSGPGQTQAQRSSQIRARDRAALRAIKDLEEKEGQLAAGGPPTRRQLRLQQLKEQAVTSANPVVPPASQAAAPEKENSPQDTTAQGTSAQDAIAQGGPAPAAQAEGAASGITRREASSEGSGLPDGISVEQALAARALIAEQAKNQLAKMEHIASLDPEAVDPEILAEQIALAERAAVLNRRARAKQKLAEQAVTPAAPQAPRPESAPRPGPSTASNLAMVTPLEFVQVPGVDRPVMKPPSTSYVPVVTTPGPKIQPSSGKGRKPATGSRPSATGPAAEAATGRSMVIARAEAAARAAAQPKPVVPTAAVPPEGQSEDLFDDLPRIPARSAYGLEPLDAATAGLARAKRMRLVQFGVLAFGIIALISGVILIISGLSR